MSTLFARKQSRRTAAEPLLHNGDRLTQPEFHRRYEAHPGKEKFELIGGDCLLGFAVAPAAWPLP
jgi:hypothetical protein